jgi:hypothetical protein
MNHSKLHKDFQLTSFVFAGLVVLTVFVFSTPSFATKGREAVGMCIDSTASGARCAWSVNDKGEIDICNKNGCIYCPSADGDCSVVSRNRPRPHPQGALPAGTKVETALGSFEVKRRVIPPLFGVEVKKEPYKKSKD